MTEIDIYLQVEMGSLESSADNNVTDSAGVRCVCLALHRLSKRADVPSDLAKQRPAD